jgi:HEAT repeat protein
MRWPDVHADGVLADFFMSPNVPDTVKTRAIFSLQNLPLSDKVLDAVAELLSKTKSDELKVQIIEVSQKFGGRAVERERNTLLALEANLSESQQVRQAAGSALRAIPQGNAAVPGIH